MANLCYYNTKLAQFGKLVLLQYKYIGTLVHIVPLNKLYYIKKLQVHPYLHFDTYREQIDITSRRKLALQVGEN